MREWIDLIETLLNEQFDREKYERELKAARDKIEWEERQSTEVIPTAVREVPNVNDKEAWDTYWAEFDWEYEKLQKRQAAEKAKEQHKLELEQQARIEGIRLAAKDAMDDMIEQDRELVSKLAKQALKSGKQRAQHLRKRALRKTKS